MRSSNKINRLSFIEFKSIQKRDSRPHIRYISATMRFGKIKNNINAKNIQESQETTCQYIN